VYSGDTMPCDQLVESGCRHSTSIVTDSDFAIFYDAATVAFTK